MRCKQWHTEMHYCRSVSLAAAAMGAKIISGSQAARGGTSQPLEPSCLQPRLTSMKTATTARHRPREMNGLRFVRVTTNGRPRKRSVVSRIGCRKREWMAKRTSAPGRGWGCGAARSFHAWRRSRSNWRRPRETRT